MMNQWYSLFLIFLILGHSKLIFEMSESEYETPIILGLHGLGKLPKFNSKGYFKSFLREIDKRDKIGEAYLATHRKTDFHFVRN